MLKPTDYSGTRERTGIVEEERAKRLRYARFVEHRMESPAHDPVLRVHIHKMVDAKVREEVDRIVRNRVAEVMETVPPVTPPAVTVKDIMDAASAATGYSIDELIGPARTLPLAKARQMAVTLTRQLRPDLSLTAIGRAFRRDHTTVLHSLGRFDAQSTLEPFRSWLASDAITALVEQANKPPAAPVEGNPPPP